MVKPKKSIIRNEEEYFYNASDFCECCKKENPFYLNAEGNDGVREDDSWIIVDPRMDFGFSISGTIYKIEDLGYDWDWQKYEMLHFCSEECEKKFLLKYLTELFKKTNIEKKEAFKPVIR